MNIGQNKQALKTYRKNILPPFENEGWTTNTGFNPTDLFKDGYSISFTAPQYQGVNIYLPNSLAGQTLSLSAEYAEGISPWLEIIYLPAGSANPVYRGVNAKTTKIEGYPIPFGATGIRVKISSTATGTNLVAFKNLQLEIGDKCTAFEEMYEINEAPNKGLVFNGRSVVNIDNMTNFLSAERDFSMEVTFTPKSTAKKSLEELLFGWSGWHEGILYNSVDNQIRIQVHFKSISNGTIGRDIVQAPVPVGKRTTATMVYKSSNRQISIFIDGVLKQRVISGYADKSTYSFNPYSTGLTFGATYGLTYGFNGVIEGGKLWDRSLTDEEIAKGIKVNPVLEYDLTKQNPASLIVLDSVKKNTGTINGAMYLQKNAFTKPSINYAPPLEEWTYSGGATYENGVAIMPSNSARVTSPYLKVDGLLKTIRISGEYLATKTAPNTLTNNSDGSHFAVYTSISYFDKDKNPVNNINGYNSNGVAKIVMGELGRWSDRSDSANTHTYTLGHLVKYIKLEFRLSTQYSQDNLKLRNVMITDVNGNDDYSVYKKQVMINKSARNLSTPKKSYKNYPFDFVRESLVTLDSVVHGINEPRVTEDGVMVEDATVNLFTGSMQIGAGYSYFKEDGWNKTTNNTAGSGSTASMGLRFLVDLAKLSNSQVYSCSATVYNPHDYAVDVHQDWCDVNMSGGFDLVTIQPKETKRIWTSTARSAYDSTYRFYDIAVQGNGNSLWIKDVQVEYKKFPTSYTPTERKKENLYISNAGRFIDTQKGSIELELTPLTGENAKAGAETWGSHDLATYIAGVGGFIVRRNYEDYNKIELVVVGKDGSNYFAYIMNSNWKRGDRLKYKLEWDVSKNITKLTVNDTLVAQQQVFKMFDPSYSYSLTYGCRGRVSDGYGCGNAIYHSLIIRNKNGETVYKL